MFLHVGGKMIIKTNELIFVENLEKMTPGALVEWRRTEKENRPGNSGYCRRQAEIGDLHRTADYPVADLLLYAEKKVGTNPQLGRDPPRKLGSVEKGQKGVLNCQAQSARDNEQRGVSFLGWVS